MDKIRVSKVEGVTIIRRGVPVRGTLHLTAHHLIFSTQVSEEENRVSSGSRAGISKPRELWIAYPIISRCTYRTASPGSGLYPSIRIQCRDFTFLTLQFLDDGGARDVFDTVKALTCKLSNIQKLYAFAYRPHKPERDHDGWTFYSASKEWVRQGIGLADSRWRVSTINRDYKFSPTYPKLLPIPADISDNVLNYAGNYRSRARVPVLTYLHPINQCSITRSSQPLAGFRGNRSLQDEKLVSAIFTSSLPQSCRPAYAEGAISRGSTTPEPSVADDDSYNTPQKILPTTGGPQLKHEDDAERPSAPSTPRQALIYGAQQSNLIVDARPTVNAYAMQAVGLGSENMDHYPRATKAYLGIDNIHVMRNSLAKVIDAIKDADITPLPPNREQLQKSHWLKHIANLLDGTALIARQVGLQHSHVLIHCSDGWDRTSQLSALSQLCLDPYFRTLEGFIVLVEKDWLSFGHMFRTRSGCLGSEKWFSVDQDATSRTSGAGVTGQPRSSMNGTNAFESALHSAKGFFSKEKRAEDADADIDEDGMGHGEPGSSAKSANSKGTGGDTTKVKETSPIFHQFLDATYQLLYQHPTRFEFNERFLRRLLFHLYSCQYGTFLWNNEQERVNAGAATRTRSVWDYFLTRRAEFSNPQYQGDAIDDLKQGHERLVFPNPQAVRWWHELFGRSDEDMNREGLSQLPGIDDDVVSGFESSDILVGQARPDSLPAQSTLSAAVARLTTGGATASPTMQRALAVEMQ